MNVVLTVYIFICIMLLIFNIVFLSYKNAQKSALFNNTNIIEKKFCEKYSEYNSVYGMDDDFKKFILSSISKIKSFVALISYIESNEINSNLKKEIRNILIEYMDYYSKKDNYEKAYYMYVLSIFDYSNVKISRIIKNKTLEFLDTKSLYVFANTMNFIYKIPDTELIIRAIEYINDADGFYSRKLFVDGMMSYCGDIDELKEKLEKNFFDYNVFTQISLLDYFRMKKIDIKDMGMRIIKNNIIDVEVKYSAMRYFISKPSKESREYFISVLKDENSFWIEKMISIQGLNRYKDDDIHYLIREYTSDRNWYVRTNAIKYLSDYGIDSDEISYILYKKDKYANEEILYQYKDDDDMTSYIEEIMELIRKEDNKNYTPKRGDI